MGLLAPKCSVYLCNSNRQIAKIREQKEAEIENTARDIAHKQAFVDRFKAKAIIDAAPSTMDLTFREIYADMTKIVHDYSLLNLSTRYCIKHLPISLTILKGGYLSI